MTITVVIATYQVPFSKVVKAIKTFENDADALAYINAESAKWYEENEGERYLREMPDDDNDFPYAPITELGYDVAEFHLWGGEQGFEAILDEASQHRLHEAYYKREYDDKGMKRPGYLRVAMGEDVTAELEELYKFYGNKN